MSFRGVEGERAREGGRKQGTLKEEEEDRHGIQRKERERDVVLHVYRYKHYCDKPCATEPCAYASETRKYLR